MRLRSVTKFLSWLLLYVLPTAFYAGLDVVSYMLVLLATVSLYELGYIFNDTVSVQREEHPSLRLSESATSYFFAHRARIIATRVLIALLALLALYPITGNLLPITLSLILMLSLFAIYNRWRNRYNVFLYVWLVFSRYLPFMMLTDHMPLDYILLFVSYPLLIGIERFSMPSYRWAFIRPLIPSEEAKALFRASYYILVLLILVLLHFTTPSLLYSSIPIAILAIYRLLRLRINK